MHLDELKKFKDALGPLRDRVAGDAQHVIQSLHDNHSQYHLPTHLADMATEAVDADLLVLASERRMLEQIQAALASVQDGSYGKCDRCNAVIDRERLEALPYATLCIGCARSTDNPHPQNGVPRHRHLRNVAQDTQEPESSVYRRETAAARST